MDGGQKINISLEASLDTKSSDMLVSVEDAKFLHNRQKYQGHVLPTSVRYEKNGWAAGWYVYNFEVGGGVIFSRNSSGDKYLAASRIKINTFPTYIYSFKIADNNDLDDANSVHDAVQFKGWFNDSTYIKADVCKEISIDSNPIEPLISVNYAVNNVDFKREIRYIPNILNNNDPVFTSISSQYGSANITMEYRDSTQDGTVHAVVKNNEVSWQEQISLDVPTDILLDGTDTFAKFSYAESNVIHYDVSILDATDAIRYSAGAFTSNNTNIVISSNTASVTYPIVYSVTVPLHKYYVTMKDISWAIQGSKILFIQESTEDPMNSYVLSIAEAQTDSVSIFNGELTTYGIVGPDVGVLSRAEFTIADTVMSSGLGIRENTEAAAAIYTASQGTVSTVPILTVSTKTFKLPGDTENRDVTIQVYFKYPGEYVDVGTLDYRTCYMSVISYPFASMSAKESTTYRVAGYTNINEPLVSHTPPRASLQYYSCYSRKPKYKIDGKTIQNDMTYSSIDYSNADTVNMEKSVVSVRDIVGRVTKLHMSIKGINGVSYSGDNSVELNLTGINTNLIFSRYSEPNTWVTSAISHGNITGSSRRDTYPPDIVICSKQTSTNILGNPVQITYYLQNINELKVVTTDGQNTTTETHDVTNRLFVTIKLVSEDSSAMPVMQLNIAGLYYWDGHSYVLFKDVNSDAYFLIRDYQYYATIDGVSTNNDSVSITINQIAYLLDGEINWVNTFNHIPNKEDVEYTDYGYVIATNKGIYKLGNYSLPITLWQCGQSGISNIGVATSEDVTSVKKFEVANDILRIYDGTTVYETDFERMDYWIGKYTGDSNSITINDLSKFCFDVKDNITGELLVSHVDDTIEFDTASLQVYLDVDHCIMGSLYFANHVNAWHLLNQATAVSGNIELVHRAGNIGSAFFPISKYSDTDGSVYQGNYGACQGIAIFKTFGSNIDGLPDGYYMNILSPLCKYVLSPSIEDDKLIVYAKKSFSHHIDFSNIPFKELVASTNAYMIDEQYNKLQDIIVTERSDIFDSSNVTIENNNSYYVKGHLLRPAAVSYTNNKLELTFGVESGNNVVIGGTTYDLSTSALTVKMTTNLARMYLPEFYIPLASINLSAITAESLKEYSNTVYRLTAALIGGKTFNTPETKYVYSNISDVNKYAAYLVTPSTINYTTDADVMSISAWALFIADSQLYGSEINLGNFDNIQESSYTGSNLITLSKEYSTDTQLVIKYYKNVTSSISLPTVMPSVIRDIREDKITYTTGTGNNIKTLKYNYKDNSISDMTIYGHNVTYAEDFTLSNVQEYSGYKRYSLSIDQSLNTDVYFKHKGFYKIERAMFNDTVVTINNITYADGVYTFSGCTIPGVGSNLTYNFNFEDFNDPTKCTPKYLDYTATDVRNSNPETNTKKFAKVLCDSEYQLIKQQWNTTVEVENFWWLDSEHILLLTKDKFIVKEKDTAAGHFDDWNGDVWKIIKEYKRTDYITSESDVFLCSSVKGSAHAYLYVLSVKADDLLEIKIYDPLSEGLQMTSFDAELRLKHQALGSGRPEGLTTDRISLWSYSDLLASSIISDSKFTALTVQKDNEVHHWLGIQYDKNLNQWAINLTTGSYIQGYGVIGINSFATGGLFPTKYIGYGLNSAVQHKCFIANVKSIESLSNDKEKNITSLDDFNIFNERVVGDENQQWYISDKLDSITVAVSLDFDDNKDITLKMTNKYSQVYSSPSYIRYTVNALGLQIKQLDELFGEDNDVPLWGQIVKYALFPSAWFLSPYTNVINYLQQTLGQYAYVHYNSTRIGMQSDKAHENEETDNAGLSEDENKYSINTLTSDDLSFDVQHISQEQSFKDNAWSNVLGIFTSMVVSATDYAMQSLTVNSMQNQSAVNDVGKKFSQAFLQNIGSMSLTGFTMQSTKPVLKSEVTAVKTLDMFYSTSADQKVFAGPGFVNAQFVAQCVAQSVTSVQLEAQQTQIFILLKELSTWHAKVELYVADQLANYLFKQADQQSSGPQAGLANAWGFVVSLVLSALAYATLAAKAMLKLSTEVINSVLSSFFPEGIKTTVTAQLSRHNYDIEGKHSYGNKSECFMWPCTGCTSKNYKDETVEAVVQEKPWTLEMPEALLGNNTPLNIHNEQPSCTTITPERLDSTSFNGNVEYNIASCKGKSTLKVLPTDMAFVIGTETFLPTTPFKNENIGEGEPVFTPPPVQDYILDKNWNLMVTAFAGDIMWVSCKDTKLFDGEYSNIVVNNNFCGIACSHVAIEIKNEISEQYLRPWAVTPDAIALNVTGLNCAYEEVAYHAFDGYGYRITDWLGSSGMNKERYTLQYCFQINDRFKRSNKLPPNQFMGNFQAVPNMSLDIKDKLYNEIQVTAEKRGLETGVVGENKDQQRYSAPVFTEQVSTLPAIIKAHSSYKLAVIDGITSLTTDVRTSQTAYKLPVSIDFNINDQLYRMTNEYICSVKHEKGLDIVTYLVPALGLTYLGSTPFMAYFYNQATRQYYIYQGGNTLQVIDMLERFRNITGGYYDFINQEVVMPCLATQSRIDKKVKDDADETDNIVIPLFRHNKVGGEVTPPITTIFNNRSGFKTISTAAGLVFQGPNRCIINRFTWSDYMLSDIKKNKGKWKKVPREEYHPFRTYQQQYDNIEIDIDNNYVPEGWTHNPFLLVTSPLGVSEGTDCKFEWEITFAWTVEMESLYEDNEYVVVNVMAETMTPGGKVFSRPTHIFLTKELFTRTGNFGYYSFKYQGNNGQGNRERLHIWSDGYIAVSGLQLEYRVMTENRNEILTIQEDVKGMKEM